MLSAMMEQQAIPHKHNDSHISSDSGTSESYGDNSNSTCSSRCSNWNGEAQHQNEQRRHYFDQQGFDSSSHSHEYESQRTQDLDDYPLRKARSLNEAKSSSSSEMHLSSNNGGIISKDDNNVSNNSSNGCSSDGYNKGRFKVRRKSPPTSRSKSDGSATPGTSGNTTGGVTSTRRLQTIESGIALDQISSPKSPPMRPQPQPQQPNISVVVQQQQQQHQQQASAAPSRSPTSSSSPLPPLYNKNTKGLFPNFRSLPPLPDIDSPEGTTTTNNTTTKASGHRSQHSHNSHYSTDAGKHGFVTYSNDNDSEEENSTGGGSIVYKYLQGEEVPPAEYALPASILKVYGEAPSPIGYERADSGGSMDSNRVNGRRADSLDSVIYLSSDEEKSVKPSRNGNEARDAKDTLRVNNGVHGNGTRSNNISDKRKSPPYQAPPNQAPPHQHNEGRAPVLPTPTKSSQPKPQDQPTVSIAPRPSRPDYHMLPYHERKRLMELEEERMKKKQRRNTVKTNNNNAKGAGRVGHTKDGGRVGRGSSGRGSGRGSAGRSSGKNNSIDERHKLLNHPKFKNGQGSSSVPKYAKGYGAVNSSDNNDNSNTDSADSKQQQPKGWFNQLAALVTGSGTGSASGETPSTLSSSEQQQQKMQNEYRDRARAFLKRTESERARMKEQSKMEELNNVMIPVQMQSFGGHSRSRMSSLSNALHSIQDCDSDDEDKTAPHSSDEESGSSYYFEEEDLEQQQQQGNSNTKSHSAKYQAGIKVWNGESTTTASPATTTSTATTKTTGATTTTKKASKKKSSSSSSTAANANQRDRTMRRERLLQEEYEFHLHTLKRENERLAQRFRMFVLVTVAVIMVGALGFALVVCVRMLLG